MKEEEENQGAHLAWVSEAQKIISFQKTAGFEEVSFPSQEEKFLFVVRLCETGYRIQ